MPPKPLKLFKGQGVYRARIKLLNEIGMRSPLFFRRRQPFVGIALMIADHVVHRVKRHAAMEAGDMRLHSLRAFITITGFIPRQIVALPDIIHQFLHQNRRKALAVVLDRTADIADIQLTLSRNERLKEEIAVIVTTATIAPLWIRTHQIKT